MFLSFEQKLIRLPSVYSLTHSLTHLSALCSQDLAKASCRSSKIKFAQILVWISKCCYIFKKLQNSQFKLQIQIPRHAPLGFNSAKRNSTPRTFRFQFAKRNLGQEIISPFGAFSSIPIVLFWGEREFYDFSFLLVSAKSVKLH